MFTPQRRGPLRFVDILLLSKSPYTLYDLCLYLEQIVQNFSRYHKYTLGADLRDTARRALKLVVRANAQREKVPVLLHVSLRRRKEDGPEGLTGIALPAIS